MSTQALLFFALYVLLVGGLALPLGLYMARVYEGTSRAVTMLASVERFFFRLAGVRADVEMDWKEYAAAVLVCNLVGALATYAIQRLQGLLPLNPAGLGAVPPELAFNTAVSFATNANWQAYGGETTMSHLTQAVALGVQNFMSPATSLAVLVALARGIGRRSSQTIGNFWVDCTRSILYVLLPMAIVFALVLVSQGVVQTLDAHAVAHLLDPTHAPDGSEVLDQIIAMGPVASQEAIKQIGSNGGGFFNVNSAHPFENPTGLSNFLEMITILLVPVAQCFMFGSVVGDRRQGWAIVAAMLILFTPLALAAVSAEQGGNPTLATLGIDQDAGELQSGGNMEGKEVRFGVVTSAVWTAASATTSNGSVNAMNDSFVPLGGLVPLWSIQLGEVVFGGVGAGLYGMLLYVILAALFGGLLIGRTPQYMGKTIEAFEIKVALLAILLPNAAIMVGTAIACMVPSARAAVLNPGPHGFSEILYSFSSASNNNGSAFAGITVSGTFYCVALGLCILVGRYWVIVPVLALAGSLAKKRASATGIGTLPTHSPMFVGLLVATVLLVGSLTYLPALALGPIAEHLTMVGR